ncbi:hypothetical protein ACVIW2_003500 [Bradyrhizobium huanghuaihaiense]|uniref:Uncharacterized protein n=1 Tax=Bradyrhizobium huanghuaihaiense TaxID=990078 RepID=A0A562R2C8_9BRAD|nr:hypothetical protein [Bradyrhizobium huanghuaihaiense]TWI63197.1 hypothetical protein IQ16_06254 [Bradyrhizobium huanghuaihaiense]
MQIKAGFTAVAVTILLAGSAFAQSEPSGRGSVTGDPAASSATPKADAPTTGTATRSNRSGSGTSSSGGKDDNGDAGRDKMPESNRTVRPESQQQHPNDK